MADIEQEREPQLPVQNWISKIVASAGARVGESAPDLAGAAGQARRVALDALRRNWEIAAAAIETAGETAARTVQNVSEDLVEATLVPVAAAAALRQNNLKTLEGLVRSHQQASQIILSRPSPMPFLALQQQFALTTIDTIAELSLAALRTLSLAADQAAGSHYTTPDQQARERVLVVDDDPDVLRVASAFLRRAGFNVTTVSGADEALAQLSGTIKFDALIADHAMPGMKGADLVTQARERHPGLPALVVTGYAGADGLRDLPPDVAVLSKPFHRDDLVSKVRSLITEQAVSPRRQNLTPSEAGRRRLCRTGSQ